MMKISICQEDNSTVYPPYLKRTFKWGEGGVLTTLRKAHPNLNHITTDEIILVH
jgi:hypothetical protein